MTELHPHSDPELHRRFQATRAGERPHAPPFARIRVGRNPARHPRHRRASGWLLLGGVAATGLVVLLARRAGRDPALEAARELIRWESPTAFLLRSPLPSMSPISRFERAVPGSPLRALDPGEPLGPPLPRSAPQ